MTQVSMIDGHNALGVEIADTLEGFSTIHSPACAAVIWRRQALQGFQDWIDHLDPSQLPSTRMIVQVGAVRDAVYQCCDLAGTPNCRQRERLVDDVAALANCFADVMGAKHLRVRLDVVTADACKQFRTAAVASRLICTYRGTGTQFGASTNGGEPAQVFTTATAEPIVLRVRSGQEIAHPIWSTDPRRFSKPPTRSFCLSSIR